MDLGDKGDFVHTPNTLADECAAGPREISEYSDSGFLRHAFLQVLLCAVRFCIHSHWWISPPLIDVVGS